MAAYPEGSTRVQRYSTTSNQEDDYRDEFQDSIQALSGHHTIAEEMLMLMRRIVGGESMDTGARPDFFHQYICLFLPGRNMMNR